MRSEDLLLFVQYIGNFLMEIEEFFLFVVFHCLLHYSHIVSCLITILSYEFALNILLNLLLFVFRDVLRLLRHTLVHCLLLI